MKIFSFLAIKTALTENCNPGAHYPAQLRCWEDCDFSYRDCLREFDCQLPTRSCSEERKNYCWFSFQSCKYECPCGDQPVASINDFANKTDFYDPKTQTTCLEGCPCVDTANKKEYCNEIPEFGHFSILGNDSRILDMKYGIYPDVPTISVDWRNIDDQDDILRRVFFSHKLLSGKIHQIENLY